MTFTNTMKKIGENRISTSDIDNTIEEMKSDVLEKYIEQSDEDAESLTSNLTSKNKQGVEKTLLEFRKRNMYLSRETRDEPTPLSSPYENFNRILVIVIAGLLLTLSLAGYKYENEQINVQSDLRNTLSEQLTDSENNLEQLEGSEWVTETMKSMAHYTYNYVWAEEDVNKPELIQQENIKVMEEEIDKNIILQLLPILKDIWVTIIPINMLLITLTKINGDNKISGWITGFFRLLQLLCLLLIFYGSKFVYADETINESASMFTTMASYVGIPTFIPNLTAIFSSIPRYVYSIMSNSGIYNSDLIILVTSTFQFCNSSYEQYIDYNLFLIKQKEMMIKLKLDMGEFSFNIDEFKKETSQKIDSDIDQGGGLPSILQERRKLLNKQYKSINQATANMNAQINQLTSLTDISIKEKGLAVQEQTLQLKIEDRESIKETEKLKDNIQSEMLELELAIPDNITKSFTISDIPNIDTELIASKVDLTLTKLEGVTEITMDDLQRRMEKLREQTKNNVKTQRPLPMLASSPVDKDL